MISYKRLGKTEYSIITTNGRHHIFFKEKLVYCCFESDDKQPTIDFYKVDQLVEIEKSFDLDFSFTDVAQLVIMLRQGIEITYENWVNMPFIKEAEALRTLID